MLHLINWTKHPVIRKWLIHSTTVLGVFMSTLDASIVNIAMPEITTYFHTTLNNVEWVVMIYLLLISSLLLTYGRIGDMYGHRPVFISGFAIFTIASLFNSLAPNIWLLIVSRALQALGAGAILAVVQAIIADTFSPAERGKAIGLNAMFVSLGLATGPSLGGFLVQSFGWQSIFTINIPIGILGTFWAWIVLPKKDGQPQKFDFGGATTAFISLSTFLLALSHGQVWGWNSSLVMALFFATLVTLSIFTYIEIRCPYPMFHFTLFRNRVFLASNLAAMINYLTQYTVTFLMPFYLVNFLTMPEKAAGYLMSAFPLTMMLVSPVAGSLSDRFGSRFLTSAGMGIICAGILLLSHTENFHYWLTIAGLAFVGIGTGLFLAPNNNAIMGSAPKNQLGVASGMLALMRNVGQVMGVAVSGAIFSTQLARYSHWAGKASFPLALHDTYLAAAVIGAIGAIVCWLRGGQK
ncbi:tetracycline resistance protein tetb signature [Lucifera butyrica]|uniref:Tetracycline resistance protein tetb signature n=1 Tax=Lucifera butyrica TaxID=1351585 RepID=A0A498R8M5_9FIRM|nr:MFS transporter [Lucifera butyrica]VBB07325.1 tetracycline resistance protein tetb signature [Lucifera butyrica]